jgi:hypothetical protein
MTRRKKVLVVFAGLTSFAVGFLSTLRSAHAGERFDLRVRDDFFAGFQGDQQALERGTKVCGRALAENPKNAEALVWHGGGLYYQGGRAFPAGHSATGNALVQRGLAEMRRAVALEPDNIAVRVPRGSILLHSTLFMPEGGYRRRLIGQGLADFQKTLVCNGIPSPSSAYTPAANCCPASPAPSGGSAMPRTPGRRSAASRAN